MTASATFAISAGTPSSFFLGEAQLGGMPDTGAFGPIGHDGGSVLEDFFDDFARVAGLE